MALEISYFAHGQHKTMCGLPISSETRTVTSTSALSGATPSNAEFLRLTANAEDIRFEYDSATSSAGAASHFLGSGTVIEIPAVSGWKVGARTA